MKAGIMFASVGALGTPGHRVPSTQKAEEVGLESLRAVERVVVPKGYESHCPYSEDGRMPGPEDVPIPDPLARTGFTAAVPSRIVLATSVSTLPQSHPFHVAKTLATIDPLPQGRVQRLGDTLLAKLG